MLWGMTPCYTPYQNVTASNNYSPLQAITGHSLPESNADGQDVPDNDDVITNEPNQTELNQRAREEIFSWLWNRIPLKDRVDGNQTMERQREWCAPHLDALLKAAGGSVDMVKYYLSSIPIGKAKRNLSYWLKDNVDDIASSIASDLGLC